MTHRSRAAAVLALAAVLAAIAAWHFATRDASLARVRQAGEIRIGYAVEPPYAFVDARGRVTGADPELARLVAARLGIARIDWVQTRFGSLLDELEEGRFDAAAAGIFVTPERARRVRFAGPSLRIGAGLLVPVTLADPPRSYGAVVASTRMAVVLAGSVEQRRLLRRGMGPERMLAVPDAATACQAMNSGTADLLALSLPTLRRMDCGRPGAYRAVPVGGRDSPDDAVRPDYTATAFARREEALATAWGEAQSAVLGTAPHLEAVEPLGFTREDLPGGATLDGILAQ